MHERVRQVGSGHGVFEGVGWDHNVGTVKFFENFDGFLLKTRLVKITEIEGFACLDFWNAILGQLFTLQSM